MNDFLSKWGEAAYTTSGFFWMALWAFALGYVISSCIQVFVTEKRMQETMGKDESKSLLLGTFFGFISSSCSFAALASTKKSFQKRSELRFFYCFFTGFHQPGRGTGNYNLHLFGLAICGWGICRRNYAHSNKLVID